MPDITDLTKDYVNKLIAELDRLGLHYKYNCDNHIFWIDNVPSLWASHNGYHNYDEGRMPLTLDQIMEYIAKNIILHAKL